MFDKAEKDATDRGIDVKPVERKGTRDKRGKGWGNDGNLQKYLRENRIVVDRAPLGMSRQKSNKTRWLAKSKRIAWTTEWVDVDGTKCIVEAFEEMTLTEAYEAMLLERERESRKRKRGDEDGLARDVKDHEQKKAMVVETSGKVTDNEETKTHLEKEEPQQEEPKVEPQTPVEDAPVEAEPSPLQRVKQTSSDTTGLLDKASATASQSPTEEAVSHSEAELPSQDQQQPNGSTTSKTSINPISPPYFYLLKPHTPSTSRVLIPVAPTDTLTASLRNHVVLEYPTFYVLDQPADALPEGFQTEHEWQRRTKEEQAELEGLLDDVALPGGGVGSTENAERRAQREEERWDERSILEMLKRDVPL